MISAVFRYTIVISRGSNPYMNIATENVCLFSFLRFFWTLQLYVFILWTNNPLLYKCRSCIAIIPLSPHIVFYNSLLYGRVCVCVCICVNVREGVRAYAGERDS